MYFVTGGGSGIGKAIFEQYPDVVNYSRSTGYDLEEHDDVVRMLDEIKEYADEGNSITVFNCWYGNGFQNYFLSEFLDIHYNNPNVTIINIGSISRNRFNCKHTDQMVYGANKASLFAMSKMAIESEFVKCRVAHIDVGLTDTEWNAKKTAPKLSTKEVAAYAWQVAKTKTNLGKIVNPGE